MDRKIASMWNRRLLSAVCVTDFLRLAEEEPDRVFRIESQDKKEDTARLIREQVRRILL